jgi:hypothetical protein
LLLGLLRENRGLAKWFPAGKDVEPEIRVEIEKRITRGERFSESVEVPLSADCKRVLVLAAESAERLGVEPEHILIGILRVDSSFAAQILAARGLKASGILEQLSKAPDAKYPSRSTKSPRLRLDSFLAGLKCLKPDELIYFFGKNAEFIDAAGKRWNRKEIWRGLETLFAPYAKRNTSYVLDAILAETGTVFVANVLWKNALIVSERRAWMHRMNIVFLLGEDDWEILLAQVTPVQLL